MVQAQAQVDEEYHRMVQNQADREFLLTNAGDG
jgi:hypothetical protein